MTFINERRGYNSADMASMLHLHKNDNRLIKQPYHPEFNAYFMAGVRRCEKHAYPRVWHIIDGIECRECQQKGGAN